MISDDSQQPPTASADSKRRFCDALSSATLEFVRAENVDDYMAAARRLCDRGVRRFRLRAPDSALPLAREIQARIADHLKEVDCALESSGAPSELAPEFVEERGAVVLMERHSAALSAALMDFINVPVSVVAPITSHYFRRRGIFVVSVPRSGTHLLFELLGAFNLMNGGMAQGPTLPQHFHFIASENSHTQAAEFFSDLANQPRGGAEHPLFVTPTLFLYRNPLDVVVSEAFYYRDPAKTPLAYYFSSLTMEERLLRLIGDDPLLGTIRRRIGKYLPWLRLPNVIPVSVEELVGPKAGGALDEQLKTIWALQLKLHVPGSPAYYAPAVFRKETQTFRKDGASAHRAHLTEACFAAFRNLHQDFMFEFGYDIDDAFGPGYVPRFVDTFRRRRLMLNAPESMPRKSSAAAAPVQLTPEAVFAYRGYLAAQTGRVFCAQSQDLPRPVDPRLEAGGTCLKMASTWNELLSKLDADPLESQPSALRLVPDLRTTDLFRLDPLPPELVLADVVGFNVVEFENRFYCLNQASGPVDVQWDDTSGIHVTGTIDEARAYCQGQARSLNDGSR